VTAQSTPFAGYAEALEKAERRLEAAKRNEPMDYEDWDVLQ